MLIFNDQLVEMDTRNLSLASVDQDNTICIGFRAATICLFVRPLRGTNSFRFDDINLQWTVFQFKENASKKVIDLQQHATQLCLGERELKNDEYLREIVGLDDNSILICRTLVRGGVLFH